MFHLYQSVSDGTRQQIVGVVYQNFRRPGWFNLMAKYGVGPLTILKRVLKRNGQRGILAVSFQQALHHVIGEGILARICYFAGFSS